jgi:hypothetical protein
VNDDAGSDVMLGKMDDALWWREGANYGLWQLPSAEIWRITAGAIRFLFIFFFYSLLG